MKTAKDISISLLEKLRDFDKVHQLLHDFDIELGRYLEMDILDDVCDLLRVPDDNTMDCEIDQETGEILDPDGYCRDWIHDRWNDVVNEKSRVIDFVEEMILEGMMQSAVRDKSE